MRRIEGVELEDLDWLPPTLREASHGVLRFVGEVSGQWRRIGRVVERTLERTGEREILDLASGGTGPLLRIAHDLLARGRLQRVTFSDRSPDEAARALIGGLGDPRLRYHPTPLDARDAPGEQAGLRTMLNAFHHLAPAQAQDVLQAVVQTRRPLLVVEVLQRRVRTLLWLLSSPFLVLVAIPTLRPTRLSWWVLTYLVPVIPLFVLWDALVSCLRIYTPTELLEIAHRADPAGTFHWEIEEIAFPAQPVTGIALVGLPRPGPGRDPFPPPHSLPPSRDSE